MYVSIYFVLLINYSDVVFFIMFVHAYVEWKNRYEKYDINDLIRVI